MSFPFMVNSTSFLLSSLTSLTMRGKRLNMKSTGTILVLQHDVLHLGHQPGVVLQRLLQLPVLQVGGDLVDADVVDHDLADQVQQLVQQLALHPDGVARW